MLSYYVRWKKAWCVGKIPKKSIELDVLMHREFKMVIRRKESTQKTVQLHVNSFSKRLVPTKRIMKSMATHTYTCAATALLMGKNTHTPQKIAEKLQNTSRHTFNCKFFQTRIIVNSSIKIAESVNWCQDWKFVSGVSFASVVRIPVTNNGSREPKKSSFASLRGKIECSPKLVTNKYQGDSKCPYMDENLVHKPKSSKICNVRVKSMCQPNMAQYVHTSNRFAMLDNNVVTELENDIDMGFHSEVRSNPPRGEIPVNMCNNESNVSTCKSKAKKRLDRVNKESCKTATGKQARKE